MEYASAFPLEAMTSTASIESANEPLANFATASSKGLASAGSAVAKISAMPARYVLPDRKRITDMTPPAVSEGGDYRRLPWLTSTTQRALVHPVSKLSASTETLLFLGVVVAALQRHPVGIEILRAFQII